jgi:YgiT-type zinc finger domain-containing protein
MVRKKACPLCGGRLEQGETSLDFERGGSFYIVRHVPAQICADCGEALIEQQTLERIERLLADGQPVEKLETPVYDLAAA